MLSSRPGAIYQQDNARPHTARLSQQCLQGYDVLPWPARVRGTCPAGLSAIHALICNLDPHNSGTIDDTYSSVPKIALLGGTGLELVTRPATIQYLHHLATAATSLCLAELLDLSFLMIDAYFKAGPIAENNSSPVREIPSKTHPEPMSKLLLVRQWA
ncbi:hypothetical protein TNCV_3101241 [Trichonephila clavipes]|nr:hypothetical protein TNCV_3101241 [Trichonephila clavipes]